MGILFGSGSLLESILSPSTWWDKFKNGNTNDVNYQIAQENLQYQRERNQIEDERYEDETAYNRAFAEDERAYQRGFAEDERAYQRMFAEDERAYNRAFAEDERAYNRALQQEIFNREDTALERQASQLSALGINPASQVLNGLGAGAVVGSSPIPSSSAGSSVPGSSSAPGLSSRGGTALHNDFAMQDMGNLSALLSLVNQIDNVNSNGFKRDLLAEQTDNQRLINNAQEIENIYLAEKRKAEIKDLQATTKGKEGQESRAEELHPIQMINDKASAERNERENQFQKDWGITDKTNATARTGIDAGVLFHTQTEKSKEMTENSPLNKTSKILKDSAKTVGNALNNTLGAGVRMMYDYYRKRKKNKKSLFNSPEEMQQKYGF